MNTTTLPCGCKHDDRAWRVICQPHLEEWLATHRIAGEDHKRQIEEQQIDG